jgi:hypothetical protein
VRHAAILLACFPAGMTIASCEVTASDRAADSVRDESQRAADDTRGAVNEGAEQTRDQAGRDAFGNAATDPAERKTDAIEGEGESKADAIEDPNSTKPSVDSTPGQAWRQAGPAGDASAALQIAPPRRADLIIRYSPTLS